MQDSTTLNPAPDNAALGKMAGIIPVPRPMGVFIIAITALAIAGGLLQNELALTLLGTIFFTILVYCFLGVFLLGLIHRRKARAFSIAIVSETVNAGNEGELVIKADGDSTKKSGFSSLPAIIMRCELHLETRDGRVIRHFSEPFAGHYSKFPVMERGVYFSDLRQACHDALAIFDAPGFFRLSLPLAQNEGPRLIAVPRPAEEAIPLSIMSGGIEQRIEPHFRKSDQFIDHRPYIPGDDPRRINWKLYSHAPGSELFVRDGEPEPPPHSRLLIIIDTQADASLYTPASGRLAVDSLCECALASALDFFSHGADILIAYSGGTIVGGKEESAPLDAAEISSALAWPAAIPWLSAMSGSAPVSWKRKKKIAKNISAELPKIPGDRAVIIFALPRAFSVSPGEDPSSLDQFLNKPEEKRSAEIVFIYTANSGNDCELEDAAKTCARLYNGRHGIRASIFCRNPTGESK